MGSAIDLQTLAQDGVAALRRGDAAAARLAFETIEAAGAATTQTLMLLAQACSRQGDLAGEDAALDRLLARDRRHVAALTIKGDRAAARGDDRAAAAWYGMAVSRAANAPQAAEIAGIVAHATAALGQAQQRFESYLRAQVGDDFVSDRFDEALAILTGAVAPQLQQPTNFYFPGLPQIAFYEREQFAWVAALEAAAPAISAELLALLQTRDGFKPYVEADPDRPNKGHALLDDEKWSAFHLFDRGTPIEAHAARCPATMAALANLPLPRIHGRAPMALFSLLEPHTHIPPHWGMLNTRLIVHLPLIVPNDCRLRVGNHTRTVEPGKVMIFDDSIEHEAWNDSDETRIILLTEIWRPELDSAERDALSAMFGSIGRYGEA